MTKTNDEITTNGHTHTQQMKIVKNKLATYSIIIINITRRYRVRVDRGN